MNVCRWRSSWFCAPTQYCRNSSMCLFCTIVV